MSLRHLTLQEFMRRSAFPLFALFAIIAFPALAATTGGEASANIDRASMIYNPWAIAALVVFFLSYLAVLFEEQTHLRKSKPVMLGAGLIWVFIAIMAPSYNIDHHTLRAAVFHGLEEYAALMLFLLAAMTYIVGAVVMAVGANDPKFVAIACINIVNAANAGGAFSPFGDITTLMVWQAGHVEFFDFFPRFFPALICFLVPAAIMSFFITPHKPKKKIKLISWSKLLTPNGIHYYFSMALFSLLVV